jgi:Flp pilus assembly protein TadD
VSNRNPTKQGSTPPAIAPSTEAIAPRKLPSWLLAAFVGFLALFVYWPAIHCGFINFDDDLYVTANAHVQNGLTLANLKWAFVNLVASNWHPLTILSHMLDCQLFGLTPWWPHLVNILLHALNSILVFVLLMRLTGAAWRSAFVAALFAVHPFHVESVVWISERKDVLSGFFGLLSLIFYARYAQTRPRFENQTAVEAPMPSDRHPLICYWLALLFLGLGLMSKAMLVTWPCVMLLLDYWPLRRFKPGRIKHLVLEKIPFFVLVLATAIITLAVQQHAGAVATATQLSPAMRVENALISYCRYLGMFLCPVNLAVFYPLPSHWAWFLVLPATVLLFAISALVLWPREKYPFLTVGWYWFLGTLLPVIGLVQVGDQALADRYMYLPSLGLLISLVWSANELTCRWKEQMLILSVAGTVIVFIGITMTGQQIGYWKDSETLFRHALDVTRDNYIADNNLAAVLIDHGEYDEAVSRLQEAVRVKPYDVAAVFNLGNAFYHTSRLDNAITEYQDALHLDSDNPNMHLNLGNAFYKEMRFDDAIAEYQQVVHLDPGNATAHNNLGETLAKKGQTGDAISQYREAIRLKPDYAQAFNNLGYLLQKTGHVPEAIAQYQQALQVNPNYDLARNNLAAAEKLLNTPPSAR